MGVVYVIYDKLNLKSLFGETGEEGKISLNRHRRNLRKGNERNKLLQEEYNNHGESRFIFDVAIVTSEHKLCELVLIELFSRVGMSYNKRRGDNLKGVANGEIIIPKSLLKEIEAFIHKIYDKSSCYIELLDELKDMENKFECKSEKIYQREFKNTFLTAKYSPETQEKVIVLFRKIEEFEMFYDKDLYDFNYEELSEVLKSFKITTYRSLQNQVATIDRYIEFAKEHQKTEGIGNQAKRFKNRITIESLLDKDAQDNMIFDQDEIMQMAMYSDNAQDGVILGLLFDGVSHKNEFEELINLTTDDVDLDNLVINIKSIDGEGKSVDSFDRKIPISQETAILIKGALEQDTKYISVKGETSRQYKIAEGDRVLRGLRGKDTVKGQIVSQRILRIAEHNDYEYLNATNISYSGQLHYARELINEHELSINDTLPLVLSRFGIPDNSSSRYSLKIKIEEYLKV